MSESKKVVVVGGGLAGLVAATTAARAGATVELIESLSELGGRARTREDSGFLFNMGPHALYLGTAAKPILDDLDVAFSGGQPPTSGGLVRRDGVLHALPAGFLSLLTTGALGVGAKLELAGRLARLPKMDAQDFVGQSLDDALATMFTHEVNREMLRALVRLTSYTHAPAIQCAGSAIQQLQAGLDQGVLYLDGGWQTLVDGLSKSAVRAGVKVRHDRVRAVREGSLEVGGENLEPDAIVLAMGPREASALVDSGNDALFRDYAESSIPVRAACLDLGLSRLPEPRKCVCLGLDQPLYFSVHSEAAKLAPDGGALIEVARYLAPEEKADRAELEVEFDSLLDDLQPGWRDLVVSKKLLTDLRVTHSVVTAARGGLAGRPPVVVKHRPGLFLAGDWVGDTGQLADASVASGRAAGLAAAGLTNR